MQKTANFISLLSLRTYEKTVFLIPQKFHLELRIMFHSKIFREMLDNLFVEITKKHIIFNNHLEMNHVFQ